MSNGVGDMDSLLQQAGGLLDGTSGLSNVDLGKADGLLDDVNIQQLLAAASLDNIDGIHSGDPLKDYDFARTSDPLVEIVQAQQALNSGRDSGSDRMRHTNTGSIKLDQDLPEFMQDMTGMDTWKDVADTTAGTLLKGVGALTGIPAVGALFGGIADNTALDAADEKDITGSEALNVAEDVGIALTGLTPFTALAEEIAASAEIYDADDGIINSALDVYDTLVNGRAVPETLSGWVAGGGTKSFRDRVLGADKLAATREARYESSNLRGQSVDKTAQDRADFAQGNLEGPVQPSGSYGDGHDSGSDRNKGRDKDGGSSRPDRDGPSGDSQGTGSANNER